MIQGPPGALIPLRLTLGPAFTDRGVRVYIEKANQTLVTTVDLTHSRLGTYTGVFSHSVEEYLTGTFVVYKTPALTSIDTNIERTGKVYRIKNDPPTLAEMLLSPLAKIFYHNRMTTVFNTSSCEHEILAWADKDGQRVANTTDCMIVVKDSFGSIKYSDTTPSPNSDGVYRFNRVFKPGADKNFYVAITIKVDGIFRTSHQTFFTLG